MWNCDWCGCLNITPGVLLCPQCQRPRVEPAPPVASELMATVLTGDEQAAAEQANDEAK